MFKNNLDNLPIEFRKLKCIKKSDSNIEKINKKKEYSILYNTTILNEAFYKPISRSNKFK